MQPLLQKKLNITAGILFGASVSIVFIVLIIIGGELYTPLKDWLAAVFSHHWIGKGVLAMLIFLIISMAPSKQQVSVADVANFTMIMFWTSFLSALAIVGFIGYEAFIK